jgi:glycerophosphoryl diester phosphodiesterase
VAAVVSRLWPRHLPGPLLSGFSRCALGAARGAAPHLPRALTVGALPEDWREAARKLDLAAIHADHRGLTAAGVAEIVEFGLPVWAYTVNEASRARLLFDWGVAAVFTDRPEELADEELTPAVAADARLAVGAPAGATTDLDI